MIAMELVHPVFVLLLQVLQDKAHGTSDALNHLCL